MQVDDFWDSTNASQSANLTVLDQPLTPTATEPTIAGAIQGAPIASQDVFTFTDGNAQALASDFTATIHWGDGTATAASSIAKDAEGVYHVLGGHTYQHPAPTGGYQVTALVSDGPSTLALANAIAVAPAPLQLGASTVSLAVTSANAQGQAIIPAGTVVGTFTQAGSPDPAASYVTSASFARFAGSSAATPLTVAVPATAGGTFVVTTAADTVVAPFLVPGSTPFTLQIIDQAAGVLAAAQGQLAVADVAPIATLVQPTVATTQGHVFAGPMATFTLPFGGTQDLSGQHAATIDRGDGSTPTAGAVVAGTTPGTYSVVGSHAYPGIGALIPGQFAGTYLITVAVQRVGTGGAESTTTNTVQVDDLPISVTGSLAPASIAGIVRSATVTNSTTPTFIGTSEPGATIRLYATTIGTSAPILVGQATADASGAWTITTIPLGDGTYTMAATAVDALGVASAPGPILPNASQGALSVQTAGPEVASDRYNAQAGIVAVTYTDVEGPLSLASLINPATYRVTSGTGAAAVALARPTVLAADPLGHSATVGIVLTHARQFRSNLIKVAIAGSAITDAAGNSLGGNFAATVRSNASTRQAASVARAATATHPKGPTARAAKPHAAAHRHKG